MVSTSPPPDQTHCSPLHSPVDTIPSPMPSVTPQTYSSPSPELTVSVPLPQPLLADPPSAGAPSVFPLCDLETPTTGSFCGAAELTAGLGSPLGNTLPPPASPLTLPGLEGAPLVALPTVEVPSKGVTGSLAGTIGLPAGFRDRSEEQPEKTALSGVGHCTGVDVVAAEGASAEVACSPLSAANNSLSQVPLRPSHCPQVSMLTGEMCRPPQPTPTLTLRGRVTCLSLGDI